MHNDLDTPPKDTLLVLVHPAREAVLLSIAASANLNSYMSLSDPNHQHIAACLIAIHIKNDPTLRQKLRWD